MKQRDVKTGVCFCALVWLLVSCGFKNSPTLQPSIEATSSSRFVVLVNGMSVPVYKAALNIWVANIEWTEPIQAQVIAQDAGYWKDGVTVRPHSKGINPDVHGDTVSFQVLAPAMLSVERNNQPWNWVQPLDLERNDPTWWKEGFRYNTALQLQGYQENTAEVLFLFVDTPCPEPLVKEDKKYIHLEAGIHTGNINLQSGQHLHLDEGAFLFGSVNIWNAHDVKVTGRGVIVHDGAQPPYTDHGFLTKRDWRPISINNSSNVSVSGITCVARSRTWAIQATASRNLIFSGIKIIAANLANLNGDGIDLCGSQDVVIEDCFFRVCDDAIALYCAMPFDHLANPEINEDYPVKGRFSEVKNIQITDCVFWNTSANVMRVGWTGMKLSTEHIAMRNCDVIHLSDCSYFHIPHSLLAIMSEDGTGDAFHSDYLLENIRLEDFSSLVGINHLNARLQNIRFKDIKMEMAPKWPSLLRSHGISREPGEGIIFENLSLEGHKVNDPASLPIQVETQTNLSFQ